MQYYGGYEYTKQTFQNSYDDALQNGDLPTQIEINIGGKDIKIDQPPQTFQAVNLRGDPLLTVDQKVYGGGGA